MSISNAFAQISSNNDANLSNWEKENREAQEFYNNNKYDEAQKHWKNAIDLAEKAQKIDPGVATYLTKLALVQDKLGNPSESERLYELAMRHMEGLVGATNQRFADFLPDLAQLYSDHGKDAQAEELYKKLLNIRQKGLNKDDPKIADALEIYEKFLRNNNRPDEAQILSEKARSIRYKQDLLSK